MRLTLNWLRDYVQIDLPPEELAHLLTMTGLEVEVLEPLGQGLDDVVVAKVLSVEKHPNADRLFLCRVDGGQGEVSVVCGAPNVQEGMRTAYAPPGVRLPNGLHVKKTKIRGQESLGVLLAEDEMGLTDDHTGIMELPSHLEPGQPVDQALPLSDWAFEIGLTPNRPDCTSVIGVAREVAARTGQTLHKPGLGGLESAVPGLREHASVIIEDAKGCPRYTAGLVWGVKIGPSPFWMRYRLHASGVRSISNVVDVTNYVMLEVGQPLHAFDFHRVRDQRIVVRRAEPGERFATLDGQERTLTGEDLMICDGQGSVGLAGVMGGLNSEISDTTNDVLVESACFDPITIRRTSKRLGLLTEASYRFERGVDIEGADWALRRSMQLLADLAEGSPEPKIIDEYPRPFRARKIPLRVDRTNAFLGTSLSVKTMGQYLEALEMEVHTQDENRLEVSPPACRVDLEREVDLMEEVARMEGYDRIPVTIPAVRPEDEPEPAEVGLAARMRGAMAGFGFTEVITYSFISAEAPDILGASLDSPLRNAVPLLKPLTQDQAVMRTTMLPGLLQAVQTNRAYGEQNLRLFEWGKVFFRDDRAELPQERLGLAGILTGAWTPAGLHDKERAVDFYDAKGVLEALLEELGVQNVVFERGEARPGYHPENAAQVRLGDTVAAHVGGIDPKVSEAYEIHPDAAFLFELDIPSLMEALPLEKEYTPYARYPAVFRDLSVVVDTGVESARVYEIIAQESLVESVDLFDLYRGDQIAPSQKALTFRICYRSQDRTLDGQEVNALHDRIVRKIGEQVGGRLRDR